MSEQPPYERIKDSILDMIDGSDDGTILQSEVKSRLKQKGWVQDHYSPNSLGARISDAVRELKGEKIEVETDVAKPGPGRNTNKLQRITDE